MSDNPKIMETFSLVGTEDEIAKFKASMAKIGWKLTYNCTSGSWLGEPVYEIKTMPKNKLIAIGMVGSYRVYLNVPLDIAIARYQQEEGPVDFENSSLYHIKEVEFDDEFYSYMIGEI